MRRTRFDNAHCPVARTTDLIGDWWTPIVLRDLLVGRHRFNDIRERTGISRAILSARLKRFESEGIVERTQYDDNPPRHEYHLTDKGRALGDIVVTMWRFGDDWMFDRSPGALVELVDRRTGEPIKARVVDERTGEPINLADVRIRPRR
jgi:DNA-binding HxlR family transcriptional regulator